MKLGTILLAAFLMLAWQPGDALGHARSVSYSSWHFAGPSAEVFFRIEVRNLAELLVGAGLEGGSINSADMNAMQRLAPAIVMSGVQVTQAGQACDLAVGRGPARHTGAMAVVSAQVTCPHTVDQAGLQITVDLLPDLGIGHSHVLSVETSGHTFEVALGAISHTWELPSGSAVGATGSGETFKTFLATGISHILMGPDHLAFLFTLMLIVVVTTAIPRKDDAGTTAKQTGSRNRLLKHIALVATAFTLGHSMTLAVSVLGWFTPDSATVEFMIAVSIIVLAFEGFLLVVPNGRWTQSIVLLLLAALPLLSAFGLLGHRTLTLTGLSAFSMAYLLWLPRCTRPHVLRGTVAFAFGLVHGFGFASVLNEIGLEGGRLALALFSFNAGVEVGQLGIVLILLLPLLWCQRSSIREVVVQMGCSASFCVACFWMAERAG